ncbi:IS1096 element passenger TnpR family protein [Streptomyces sp. NBC_00569]|uniref:IS1096 element passenger TnpR family protein n=1 Tax=Streptomyces sp. NBC_00569 TaxID=2975780 RepID=UPI003FCC8301
MLRETTLRTQLIGMKPPLWRRLRVPSDTTLGSLHHVIQAALIGRRCSSGLTSVTSVPSRWIRPDVGRSAG